MNTKRQTGIAVAYTSTTITWTASDGSAPPIVLDVDALTDALRRQATFHGLDQKVTDAGAMGNGKWDGEDKPARYATVAERMQRMRLVADRLAQGEWSGRRNSDPLAGKTEEQLKALIAAANAKLTAIGVK